METITLKVPSIIAKHFKGQKIVNYNDFVDFNMHYNFSEEKVTFEELSNFLGKAIETK